MKTKEIIKKFFLTKIIKKILAKTQQKQKRKAKLQLKLKINNINYKKLLLNIIIFGVLILLFILKTNFLKIQKINIISNDENANSLIIEKKLQYLKNKYIFNIDKYSLKKQILSIEENLKNIKIQTIYPNTINIEISSYPIIFKTNIKNKKILISEN
jgi:cell division septal protein FtsQ